MADLQAFSWTMEDERDARELMKGILIALEVRISLMIWEGKVGTVATTDEAVMGYYVVKWLSKPFSLQEDKEGMSGVISTGMMVTDALFHNRVAHAPFWYTQSRETTLVKVRYVLLTGLEMEKSQREEPVTSSMQLGGGQVAEGNMGVSP